MMIPVYQTKTVANDGTGNCFNACVASILELPLRDVCQVLPKDQGYWQEWTNWGDENGYEIVFVDKLKGPPKGFAIASGYGGRIFPDDHIKAGEKILHAVVVFNGEFVHDPFPTGKGIDDAKYWWIVQPLNA